MARKPKGGTQPLPTPAGWLAHNVEMWAIERLKPYDRNAKKHPPEQIEQLRAAFRQFGWTIPLLVREDGTLIAGHGRFEAGKLEGFKSVPVIVATGWSEEKCRAYTLVDNKVAEGSEWDDDLLQIELTEIGNLGIDLSAVGFSVDLGADASAASPDASPQLEGLTYSVVVRCKDEAHQGELLEQLEAQGLTCEALIS